jgi:hypothetical protein
MKLKVTIAREDGNVLYSHDGRSSMMPCDALEKHEVFHALVRSMAELSGVELDIPAQPVLPAPMPAKEQRALMPPRRRPLLRLVTDEG